MNSGLRPGAPATRIELTFEEIVVPHLHAAHRLARWLMRNEHDAEDVVQEASLRAFQYLRTFAGGNARAWFLRIVRNTCYARHGRTFEGRTDPFDEEQHETDRQDLNPETLLLRTADVTRVARAVHSLPARFRQLLTLRELEGLSYRELAHATGLPMGSVMSGLSRARRAFRGAVNQEEIRRNAIGKGGRPNQRWKRCDSRRAAVIHTEKAR